jgi:hypothetical protein
MATTDTCCLATFSSATGTYQDPLLAGPCLSRRGTLVGGGGLLKRGQVLSWNTGIGKWELGGANPSQGILAADVDAGGTAVDITVLVYVQGKFKADQIIWPGGSSTPGVVAQLHDSGVYTVPVLGSAGGMLRSLPMDEAEFKEAKQRFDRYVPEEEKEAALARLAQINRDDKRQREHAATAEEEKKRIEALDKADEEAAKAAAAEPEKESEFQYPEYPGAESKGAPSVLGEGGKTPAARKPKEPERKQEPPKPPGR